MKVNFRSIAESKNTSMRKNQSFGMKMNIGEKAASFYAGRLKNLDVENVLGDYVRVFQEKTKNIDIDAVARIDVDEFSSGKPELTIIKNSGEILRAKRYPAWILPSEVLPEPALDKGPLDYAVKHAISSLRKIMHDNGYGLSSPKNPF